MSVREWTGLRRGSGLSATPLHTKPERGRLPDFVLCEVRDSGRDVDSAVGRRILDRRREDWRLEGGQVRLAIPVNTVDLGDTAGGVQGLSG